MNASLPVSPQARRAPGADRADHGRGGSLVRALSLPLSLPLALSLTLAGCASSPLERSQVVLYSEADMAARGVSAYRQMREETPASADARATRYVQCVADHVIEALPDELRSRYDWEVTLFADAQVNAFALPGGKIGVYEGLLEVAINQHQLGAVMAHEVGHVLANHSNERASQTTLRNVGFGVAQILGVSDATLQAVDMGTQRGIGLPFNRTQESEADVIGLTLMARAGFEPEESITLWENMAAAGGARPPELLSTHPAPSTRMGELAAGMAAAERELDAAQAKGRYPDCIR